ncbi:hypothetical protein BXZ70DRAFT_798056 [Cristinia sonorae]|uniref:DNA polymerase n=1 Tax=Cristinia sonorae TaxID=1940300 RepID=A0A8K0XRU5_9AGAR|nr:hypothetical protein BXZ70DRAFT_798056 [Cristinia sonorae]
MASYEPTLSIRINQIDHTVIPSGTLDDAGSRCAPVIRIYGKASNGQKACLHVHRVYPYFFIEYLGKTSPNGVSQYIATFTHSLNHAIAVSLKRNPSSPKSQFIRAVVLVKGVHFYGFHSKYSPFLKIYINDPAYTNRAATILQSGIVMKTRFRVYENHLTFALQFLCDFGLYGCGWIDLSANVWRRGEEDGEEDTGPQLNISTYHKQSRMQLELDVESHEILNRQRLTARNIHHKLCIPAPTLPSEPLVISVRELWEDERKRRIARGLPPSPDIPKDLSEGSRGRGPEWVAEARWWEHIEKRIVKERELLQAQPPKVEDEEEEEWTRWVMTTFDSVQALWDPRHRTWRPEKRAEAAPPEFNPYDSSQNVNASQVQAADQDTELDIDETLLASQEISVLIEQEEVEEDRRQKENEEDADNLRREEAAEEVSPEDMDASPRRPTIRASPTSNSEDVDSGENPFDGIWHDLRTSTTPDPERVPTVESKPMSSPPDDDPDPSYPKPIIDDSPENPFFVPESPRKISQQVTFANDAVIHNGQPEDEDTSSVDLHERPQKRRKLGVDHAEMPLSSYAFWLSSTANKQASLFSGFSSGFRASLNSYQYQLQPPTIAQLTSTMEAYNLPHKIYQAPYYSVANDASDHPWEFAGLSYHIKGSMGVNVLEEWDGAVTETSFLEVPGHLWGWEYASSPPTPKQVRRWWQENKSLLSNQSGNANRSSQIEGPTQKHPYGFKTTPAAPVTASFREKGNMEVLAMEIFAPSGTTKQPDPGRDEVVAIFWCLHDPNVQHNQETLHQARSGVIVIDTPHLSQDRLRDWQLEILQTELDLLNRVIDLVQELDPDIVLGWEVQSASWGYLDARGRTYGLDLGEQISRAPGRADFGNNQWGERTSSTFRVIGRHVLNVWRIIRAEQNFTSHTFEHAVFQLLHRRTPRYRSSTLTSWYNSNTPEHGSRLLRYFADRTAMLIEIVDMAEIVSKNAEFARVFGIDFFSVLSRGSQFKVESFMFRIAKPESFVLLSPSRQDVGKQNAAECMPLIMEPLSAFYSSPLVVLDFQSLYPSVMIAYNYCYSTCLGRVTDFKGQNKFGVTELRQPNGLLETLHGHINVAPNGMIYVKQDVRNGLLGRMLTELLDTRVMVKQAMKSVGDDKVLRRVLDARQLGLKFIANVTYGYTSASFSGRMPAVEIADSIVQTGRETLERAIQLIQDNTKWGGKVVYGDTDSLFIYLPGKTKDQAFRIGHDIADTVTAMNPAPIKLKFEKVYLPCVLMAKKRYVGFKYESPDEQEAGFDAKGIETVRRDGVQAQRKMVETCLKLLFRTQDLSKVKEYCYASWTRILENKASIQDFIFAKEVKMGNYSDKAPPPPGVVVAARRQIEDPNDEPQYGERIPYVIIRDDTLPRLVDRAVAPDVVLNDSQMHLDARYYITRVLIPPLERIFNLTGADVRGWYDEMPKKLRMDEADSVLLSPRKEAMLLNRLKIDEHFLNSQCLVCKTPTDKGLCRRCRRRPQTTISSLLSRVHRTETRLRNVHAICASCAGTPVSEPVQCESLDCQWLFSRKKQENKAEMLDSVFDYITEVEEGLEVPSDSSEEDDFELVTVYEEVEEEDDDLFYLSPTSNRADFTDLDSASEQGELASD